MKEDTLFIPTVAEVFEACSVLFGHDTKFSIDFLKYLQPSGVKAAYWKKAKETHPDMAITLGSNPDDLNLQFKEVNLAYELLNTAIKEGDQLLLRKKTTPKNKPKPDFRSKPKPQADKTRSNDHFYNGMIPRRELLIGQYLYYSGIISWRTLIDSIIWQRRNRPMLGKLASDWNILTNQEIQQVLNQRKFNEKFGEAAIRSGLFTPSQLMTLLGRQRRLQKPIGAFYIQKYLLHTRELERIVREQRQHNRKAVWDQWS